MKEFQKSMNRTLAIAVLAVSSMTLGAVAQMPATRAASTAPAGPTKIAVIAFQAAVAQTNEGQRDFADLQKKFEPKRAQLKSLNDQIESMKKQLQGQASTMTPAQTAATTKSIDEKTKQLQRDAQDAQADFQQAVQDMYNSLASKVYDVLNTYAKQHDYTMVVDVSQQQSPVLWAADSTNITKQIVDAYNAKSGVPAPAQPAGQSGGLPSAPAPKPASH